MKTLNLRNVLFGLVAVLAISLTSCQQDSIISPIEIQDTEGTELRACDPPSITDNDFLVTDNGNRIYVYAFDHDGTYHQFRYSTDGGNNWTELPGTYKYHQTIRNPLPCTNYIFQIREWCFNPYGWGPWSATLNESVTTGGDCSGNSDCPAPAAGDIIFNDNPSTTLYLFPDNYQVVIHEFEVSFEGGPFVSLGVRNSHYSAISNKQCGTYEIRLIEQCDDGNWSDETTVTFETCQ